MDVGFVGLGQMGSRMAGQLIASGHRLTVWNRDRTKAEALIKQGATLAESPAHAAASGVVFTMLANDEALEAVTFGKAGLLEAAPDTLHISCSTVSVELTARLTDAHTEVGQRFVSAQVLGRPDVAASGNLSMIAAGAESDLEAAQPLFDAIGAKTLHMGDKPVMAAASKVAANFGIASVIQTISEQIRIASAQGVPATKLVELLVETNFGNRMFGVYGPLIAEQRFEPAGFPLKLGRKDVGLAIAAAGGADLPFADLLSKRMDAIIAADGGERDWSALGQAPKAD